jgi:hypothetical protein
MRIALTGPVGSDYATAAGAGGPIAPAKLMRRYVIAAGLAASAVGGLMMVLVMIGLATGVQPWGVLVDVLLLVGLGTWFRRALRGTRTEAASGRGV